MDVDGPKPVVTPGSSCDGSNGSFSQHHQPRRQRWTSRLPPITKTALPPSFPPQGVRESPQSEPLSGFWSPAPAPVSVVQRQKPSASLIQSIPIPSGIRFSAALPPCSLPVGPFHHQNRPRRSILDERSPSPSHSITKTHPCNTLARLVNSPSRASSLGILNTHPTPLLPALFLALLENYPEKAWFA